MLHEGEVSGTGARRRFNEAELRDPRNVSLLTQHALFYLPLRRFPEALLKCDHVLNITHRRHRYRRTKGRLCDSGL